MARILYSRVPKQPPYVTRSTVDRALLDHANDGAQTLLITGGGARHGVTRTLASFVRRIPHSRFLHGARYPVVIDLNPVGSLPFAETLVTLRNLVVRTFNRRFGMTRIGAHFAQFDALYTIWRRLENVDPDEVTPLEPTTRRKLAKGVGRLAISFATAGTIEIIAPLNDLMELSEKFGWGLETAADAAKGKVEDQVFEYRAKDFQGFMDSVLHPGVDRRLQKLRKRGPVTGDDVAMLMRDSLTAALVKAEEGLKTGCLFVAADSIDEVGDPNTNSRAVRFCLAGVMTTLAVSSISVLCGRTANQRWLGEFRLYPYDLKILGPLPKADIRWQLEAVGVQEAVIDRVLGAAGRGDEVTAGAFEEACRKHIPKWPPYDVQAHA